MLKPNNPIQLFSLSTSWQAATLRRVLLSQGTMFFLKTTLVVLLMTSLFSAPGLQAAEDKAQPILPRVDLKIAGKTLSAELASSPNQRFMGLSFRKSMAENEAMLFVFPTEEKLVFTMRNTLIPLSIAYISDDLIIKEIVHMPVGPNQLFPSKDLARFALEVNHGWFERNKISVGAKISLDN